MDRFDPWASPPAPWSPSGMEKIRTALASALGGAVCGGFIGVLLGTVLGIIFGAFVGDVSLGLDGAVLGGAAVALGGAVYGGILGAKSQSHFARAEPQAAAKVTPHVDR